MLPVSSSGDVRADVQLAFLDLLWTGEVRCTNESPASLPHCRFSLGGRKNKSA